MQITLNIPNQEIFEKIIWLLNKFKSDGVEIVVENKELEELEKIINDKSKNSKVLNKEVILNPHIELSRDIS